MRYFIVRCGVCWITSSITQSVSQSITHSLTHSPTHLLSVIMENQMMSSNLNNVCVSNDGAPLENNGEQPLDLSVNVSVNRANGDEAGVVNPTVASVSAETIAVPVAAADEGLAINEANASVGNAIEGNAEAASISGREVGETAGASADSFVDVSTHNRKCFYLSYFV